MFIMFLISPVLWIISFGLHRKLVRNLWDRGIMYLVPGHLASEEQDQDLNPCSLTLKSITLTTMLLVED